MAKQSYATGPRRRPPSHPGVIIGSILEDIGVPISAAASAMGVSETDLADLVRGAAAISPEMAVRLKVYMGNGEHGDELWLRLQADHDLWHARRALKDQVKSITPAPRKPKVA